MLEFKKKNQTSLRLNHVIYLIFSFFWVSCLCSVYTSGLFCKFRCRYAQLSWKHYVKF